MVYCVWQTPFRGFLFSVATGPAAPGASVALGALSKLTADGDGSAAGILALDAAAPADKPLLPDCEGV